MTWIHTAVRKPTEEDADENERVLVRWPDSSVATRPWDLIDGWVAWMPIPKFTPLPPVPDGYELLTDCDSEPDSQAMFLTPDYQWMERLLTLPYSTDLVYCVPCKPAWVPSIVTSGFLKSGTWLAIDSDEEAFLFRNKPTWKGSYWDDVDGEYYLIAFDEAPQITGEKAIWQVP